MKPKNIKISDIKKLAEKAMRLNWSHTDQWDCVVTLNKLTHQLIVYPVDKNGEVLSDLDFFVIGE